MRAPFFWLSLLLAFQVGSQPLNFIPILNPSFEDHPGAGKLPNGWYFCGPVEETPPDIHPGGWFRVTKLAEEGQTYVGMVVRDNGTTESIGQGLNHAMVPGQCYHFRFYAARSLEYFSVSRSSYQLTAFDQPVRLQLWGATKNCTERMLLAESQTIDNPEWQPYDLRFQATKAFDHIILQATYAKQPAYNGSILLDRLSPLVEVAHCADTAPPTLPDIDLSSQSLSDLITQIRFDPITEQMEPHYFKDASGQAHFVNKFLWQSLQLIRQSSPDKKLLFAVGGLNTTSIEARMFSLQQMLLQSGFNFKQFKIRPLKKQDKKKEWDGKNKAEDLLIRMK